MGNVSDRTKLLHEVLDQRIVVLGGPMGTMIQQRNLSAADFGGPQYEGCNEHLVLTRPDVILDIDRQYLAAGADFIGTDTFGATPLVLARVRPCRQMPRNQRGCSQNRASGGSGVFDAEQTAVCELVHWPHDEGDYRDRRRDVRAVDRALPPAGARTDRRRRGRSAGRDVPGHAQRQGRAHRHSSGVRQTRRETADHGQRHDRADRARCSQARRRMHSSRRCSTWTCSASD